MRHKRSTFRRARGMHHAGKHGGKNRGTGGGVTRAIAREQAAEDRRKVLYGW